MGFGLCGFVCSVVVFEVELTGTSYKFNCVMIDRLTISEFIQKENSFWLSPKITFRGVLARYVLGGGEVSNMFFTFALFARTVK